MEDQPTQQTMENRPVHKNESNGVHLAVFSRTGQDGNPWFSTTLRKPYRDKKTDQWREGSYKRAQLKNLIELAQEAIDYIDTATAALQDLAEDASTSSSDNAPEQTSNL